MKKPKTFPEARPQSCSTFIYCSLFTDTLSVNRLYSVECMPKVDRWMMNWKRRGRKGSWPNLMYNPGIFFEWLRKATKDFGQDSRSPGWDLNRGPAEYEAGMLTLDYDGRSPAVVWRRNAVWKCTPWLRCREYVCWARSERTIRNLIKLRAAQRRPTPVHIRHLCRNEPYCKFDYYKMLHWSFLKLHKLHSSPMLEWQNQGWRDRRNMWQA
jgi:hypothetical protein